MGKHKRKRTNPFHKTFSEETLAGAHRYFKNNFAYPELESEAIQFSEIFKCDAEVWRDPVLEELKQKLNETKSHLSHLDINQWHAHTKETHPGSMVIKHLRFSIKAEFCTQAWCKFWEIISTFDLISHCGGEFVSVHLCEAPGAFVSSLNHYLHNHGFSHQWRWLGVSLNPYYEGNELGAMVDDDRLIIHTLDKWYFGDDDVGDIMRPEMIDGLLDKMGRKAYLVTGDGSIDCANVPAEQESVTSHLHFCEVVCALHVLAPGGHLVIKMFTLFEAASISLMYLLRCCFRQLRVFKPLTSKPGNSEVYVVAKGYKSLDTETLATLRRQITSSPSTNASLCCLNDIPEDFLYTHHQICTHYAEAQMQAITNNVELFKRRYSEGTAETKNGLTPKANCQRAPIDVRLTNLQEACLVEFLRRFAAERIPDYRRLVPLGGQKALILYNPHAHQWVRQHGSYEDRQSKQQQTWAQRVKGMTELSTTGIEVRYCLEPSDTFPSHTMSRWHLVTGHRVQRISSSKFCSKSLIRFYVDVLHHAQKSQHLVCSYHEFLERCVDDVLECFGTNSDIFHVKLVQVSDSCLDSVMAAKLNQMCDSASVTPAARLFCVDIYEDFLTDAAWCTTERNTQHVVGNVMKNLSKGDALLMSAPPALTRLNACLMYCLQYCFTKMNIIVPSDGTYPVCLIVAIGYNMPSPLLLKKLESVLCAMAGNHGDESVIHREEDNKTLLSFVPMPLLCESPFYSVIYQANDAFIIRRANHLLALEKQLHKVSSDEETLDESLTNKP